MHDIVGRANVLFITLDCLRYDVARQALEAGMTPTLRGVLPGGWEMRETPGTFTLPSHLAFFHGFLPTPPGPGPHPRLFALQFEGSLTTTAETFVFEGVDNIIAGFQQLGYRTMCVGGVGFFNKLNPLGRVLPGFFEESVWTRQMGVASPHSTRVQVDAALDWLGRLDSEQAFLLFINISATHPPHAFYLPGAKEESIATQQSALAYVDGELPRLFDAVRQRGRCFCMLMSDHGEAHGEDGRRGHRIAHPVVTTVPYADFLL